MAFYIARTDFLTSNSGIYLLKGEVVEDVPGKSFTYPDKFGYIVLQPERQNDNRRSYSSESEANSAIASRSETGLKVVEE